MLSTGTDLEAARKRLSITLRLGYDIPSSRTLLRVLRSAINFAPIVNHQ
jgi:hypothetical protein